MKNKSIGSLVVLALLAPSCGGGKVVAPTALAPRWTSQFRVPTAVNLTAIKIGSPTIAIVAGEAGNFLLTDDGGTTWTPMEYAPANRGGDALAMDASIGTIVAVGSDESTGNSAAWTSTDGLNFGLPDDAAPRFVKPWVDVTLVAPATSSMANATYRLRDDGNVDAYQGGFLYTANSTLDTVGGPTPWTKANGIWYQGLTGVGMVCGDNAGLGRIRYSIEANSATWLTATITPTSPSSVKTLRRFSMLAASSGFACGDFGTVVQCTSLGNWIQIPGFPATVNFRGIHFPLGADVGWAVGESGNIYKLSYDPLTTIWTWTHQGIGVTSQQLNAVAFYNNRFGFAVGNAGTVLRTTDGGANWFEVSFPPLNPTPQFNAVDFSSDAKIGLVVGNGGTVQRTFDGGNTWEPFTTGVPVATVTGVSIPRFGGGDTAYLCGSSFVRAQSTLKGTASSAWATQTLVGNHQAIHFALGDQKGVVVGLAGDFAMTANGGTAWSTAFTTPPPAGVNWRALCSSPNGALVFAAGDTGGNGVLTSSDVSGAGGALVWSGTLPNITSVQINAIQAPMGSTTSVFAGTQDGKVYRLNQAQSAWDTGTVVVGANTAVVGLAFVSETHGWAVVQDTAAGSLGGVFETTNRGTTWTRSYLHVKVSNTNLLRAIWMNSSLVGNVVGDNGMILRTTTGGN